MMLVHEQQLQPNWCWVACFRMACSSFSILTSAQCLLAQQFLSIANCCPAGSNPACNATIPETEIPGLYSSVALAATVIPISDGTFRQSLSSELIVLGMIAYPATYHFIIISSFADGAYTVNDPEYAQPLSATFVNISAYPNGSLEKAWSLSKLKSARID